MNNTKNSSINNVDTKSFFVEISTEEASLIKGGEHNQNGKPKRYKNTP